MMRLPYFDLHRPTSESDAVRMVAEEGPAASFIAGGTDLLPNMKRRQQMPRVLVSLQDVSGLRSVATGTSIRIGAGTTLTDLVRDGAIETRIAALWQAAAQVATPHLRNVATLGGNLCLDTRCSYYDQSYEWRKAIDFCMKKDGQTCWVAPSSDKCLAVSSTDTAPALIALGASVTLVSVSGTRQVPLADFYINDGMNYAAKAPGELLSRIEVALNPARRSCYWKLRRRGSFDFPVLSVAARVDMNPDDTVCDASIVLGSVSSSPQIARDAATLLVGKKLTDDVITACSKQAAHLSKPMDNTDFVLSWRKRVTAKFVQYALRELRGEDMSGQRRAIQHHDL